MGGGTLSSEKDCLESCPPCTEYIPACAMGVAFRVQGFACTEYLLACEMRA